MRVLVACEYSGRVRDAFAALGHYALSCDLLPTEAEGNHYQGDVSDIINDGWDLMVAHPPCTDLAVSGARHFAAKIADGRQQRALDFVQFLMDAPIDRICIENPISIISSRIRKPEQIIQPWQFGHPEFKATCLWLKGLQPLTPVNPLVPPTKPTGFLTPEEYEIALKEWRGWNRVHQLPPGPNRWKERSRTFEGVAAAMDDQWGREELKAVA